MNTTVIFAGSTYYVLWAPVPLNDKEITQAKAALTKSKTDALPIGVRAFPCNSKPEAAELAAVLGS